MSAVVVYESTRGRTKAMAEAICEGIRNAGVECSLVSASDFTDIGDACALAIGSSTRMKRTLPRTRQILDELKGVENMPAAGFGSYGWSGEAPDFISQQLEKKGAKMVRDQPLRVKDFPREDDLEKCRTLGRTLAEECKQL
ncbi:MAG: FprA family A-type flavoprotein [Candidatus Thorarchaeota archaeon]|nr:FprA family A-type flavoprotein [Candidatus Thorarchaeota archaeon]